MKRRFYPSPNQTTACPTAEVKALAASAAPGRLEPFSYDPGPLGTEEVDSAAEQGGASHFDLSMLDNEWGISAYPFVPAHEAINARSRLPVGALHARTRRVHGTP